MSLLEYLYFAGDDRFGALGVSTSADDYLRRITSWAQGGTLCSMRGGVSAMEARFIPSSFRAARALA